MSDDQKGPRHNPIDLRNLSIKCGHCNTYQILCHYHRKDDWNVYTYECENDVCDPDITRTYLELPVVLDDFANRDPDWHGGAVHAGAHGGDS